MITIKYIIEKPDGDFFAFYLDPNRHTDCIMIDRYWAKLLIEQFKMVQRPSAAPGSKSVYYEYPSSDEIGRDQQ